MENGVASLTDTGAPPPAPVRADVRLVSRLQRWWWLVAALTALVSLVVGGSIQHAVDQHRAARDLYQVQVLTTLSLFTHEEQRQIALPMAQRSIDAFVQLAASLTNEGSYGPQTLQVTLGSGSTGPFTQIAFSTTVASPYATTTFISWYERGAGPGGMNQQGLGACVLSSSLLGPGRATTTLNLGETGLEPCTPDLWSPTSTDPLAPRLGLSNVPRPAG